MDGIPPSLPYSLWPAANYILEQSKPSFAALAPPCYLASAAALLLSCR